MLHTEQNFITEQERVAVKQKVLDLEEHWSSQRPDRYSNVQFSTLGNALYILEADNQFPPCINHGTRRLLLENFNWLYQKICSKIADQTDKNTQLHPQLTAPGFHIGHVPGSYHVPFYHNDMSILTYDREATLDHSYSILIPIEIPSSGAYLEYLDENNQVRTLPYELGAWHQWKATVNHKVGDLLLLENEYRITLQCHYYLNVRTDTNYLFF